MKGTSACVVGPKAYEWEVPKINGISQLQCFEYKSSGVIIAHKSHNVGPGVTLKSKKFEYSSVPVQEMVAIQHAPFTSTDGSKDNAFLPRQRMRDSQVLTRDVSICQMWLEWEE